jgi:hypothetical protein
MTKRRSVGGAARLGTPSSAGSSPAVAIKTTSVKVLRRMLADCDRKLQSWDRCWRHSPGMCKYRDEWFLLDNKRKAIRLAIKARKQQCTTA